MIANDLFCPVFGSIPSKVFSAPGPANVVARILKSVVQIVVGSRMATVKAILVDDPNAM